MPDTFTKHTLLLISSIFKVLITTIMIIHKSVTTTLEFYNTGLLGQIYVHVLEGPLYSQTICYSLCFIEITNFFQRVMVSPIMWGGRWSFPKPIIEIKEKLR